MKTIDDPKDVISYSHIRPFLQNMAEMFEQKERIIIGIDGKCAAGKTTLADHLASLFDTALIRMDDFFLPLSLRTPNRLNEAGGNLHYERFLEEVVEPLQKGESFSYRVFDCSVMDYASETKKVPLKPLTIVEGSYSMRHGFSAYYDLKVFMDVSDECQKERIIQRNGLERYKTFKEKWIPMENRYFDAFRVKERCDYVLASTAPNTNIPSFSS